MIVATPQLLDALRTAKAQCVVRVVQLSGCRTCGQDQRRFEQAVDQLNQLIAQLEVQDVQALTTQS